jgi:hypothetical protein
MGCMQKIYVQFEPLHRFSKKEIKWINRILRLAFLIFIFWILYLIFIKG